MFILFIFILILLILTYLIYHFFFRPKNSHSTNCFFSPYSPSPYSPSHVVGDVDRNINESYDVIIIGSGLSSLVTGCLLSKEGQKVIIFEQCEKIGGFSHTFDDHEGKGYEFAPGIHYICSFQPNWVYSILCDYVSDGKLKFEKLAEIGEPFDTLLIGNKKENMRKYEICTPVNKFKNILKRKFPKEKKRIEYFLKECEKCVADQASIFQLRLSSRIMRWILSYLLRKGKTFRKYMNKTIREVIEESFDDPDLKLIFSYMTTLVGSFNNTSASIVLCLTYMYLQSGSWYPKNGCSSFGKCISNVIYKNGGKVLANTRVKRIIVNNNGEAIGVELMNKTIVKAKNIVSGAGVYNTYKFLLPKKYNFVVDDYKPSTSHFFVFAGFNASPQVLGFPKSGNVFLFEDYKTLKDNEWLKSVPTKNSKEIPLIFIGFTHNVHPLDNNTKTSVILLTEAKYEWFKKWENLPCKNRGTDYSELKEVICDKIMKEFYKHYPKAENYLDFIDTSTPISSKYWINYQFGESYGMECSKGGRIFNKFSYPKENMIKNFYLTGVDCYFMCGVGSAFLSGMFTAQIMMKKDYFRLIFEKMMYDINNKSKTSKKFR